LSAFRQAALAVPTLRKSKSGLTRGGREITSSQFYILLSTTYPCKAAPESEKSISRRRVDRWKFMGYERLLLSTTPFLDRAIRLYEKFGFRRNGEPPHDLFGTPLITMDKIIKRLDEGVSTT
jgi:hypothetical protein